ncbi:MAG: hypothetical protein ACM3XZ_05445 [Betaproteobacteria bacterium]
MTDHTGLGDLERQLRQALAGPPQGEEPSAGVVAAVMAQVRREAAERPAWSARRLDLLVGLLTAGIALAWAVVNLGLTLWPGAGGLLRVPAESVLGAIGWWIVKKAGGTLLTLLTSGVCSLLPLALVSFLALLPLAFWFDGRSPS